MFPNKFEYIFGFLCVWYANSPGLNTVIAEIVKTLYYRYSVSLIYGFRWGYQGLCNPKRYEPFVLTPQFVKGISEKGGTILGTARGGLDVDVAIQVCQDLGINQLYVIGGDGTHRGAIKIAQRIQEL